MTPNELRPIESIAVEPRTRRALTECLCVVEHAPDADIYEVYSGDHSYTVDARDGVCECPDYNSREARCKHLRRCEFATGSVGVPADIARDDLDDVLLNRLADRDHPAYFGAPTTTTDADEPDERIVADGGRPTPSDVGPVDGCDDCAKLRRICCASCFISGRAFNAVEGDQNDDGDD